MENTLSNKARFFAQYWGQKVLKKYIEGLENFITEPDGFIRSPSEQTYLELTPLSNITDEDAKKIAVLAYKISIGDIVSGKEYLHQFDKVNASYPTTISDYLRSKGYALPYMGLSVEKLIEYGWVKLKTK